MNWKMKTHPCSERELWNDGSSLQLVFFGGLVAGPLQLRPDFLALLEEHEPLVHVVVGVNAAVPLRQILRLDVLVQRVHVVAVEEDALLHRVVQQRLEEVVDHVEDPRLVHDVDRVDLHGVRRLKPAGNMYSNREVFV